MANEAIPEALRRRYIDSFPGKCAAFEAVISRMSAGGVYAHDVDAVATLRDLAHKLAGSAGMYGFDDLGNLAREVVHAVDASAGPAIIGGLAQTLLQGLTAAHLALDM